MTVFYVILATIISTALGGLFAVKLKDRLHLVLGFSAGAVLGVALFDLLPEAVELTGDVRIVALLIAVGFSIYLFIDRLFSLHRHDDDDCNKPNHSGKLGAMALVVHSFLDGLGIGLAFKVDSTIGWIVTAGVLTHDFSDGINTVGMIMKGKGDTKSAIKWLAADALAPAAGVIIAAFLSVSGPTLGLILAVFVGLFLYIGASDLIPESHHRHPVIWTTVSTMIGMALMYTIISFAC